MNANYTQHNGILLDVNTMDAIRETESIVAAFTYVKPARPSVPRTHRMFQLVQAGLSNTEAVARIKAEYGNVPTNTASIAWVRQAIRDANAGKDTKQAQYAVKTMAKLQ
jgi:hypothetical protein